MDPEIALDRVRADLRWSGVSDDVRLAAEDDGWRVSGASSSLWVSADRLTVGLVASMVQDVVFDNTLGTAWPMCPTHSHHQLRRDGDDWVCPTDADRRWPIGTLAG